MYNDIIFKLGELAVEAMIYEVSCFPSFGLVSPTSNGSHKDMDYYTFIDSSTILYRYFLEMAHNGYSDRPIDEIFVEAREIGKRAEKAMFLKTKGVNTHKGMIFVLGLAITATSNVIYNGKKFQEISNIIKKMSVGLVERELKNLKNKKSLTHGEKIFLKYGISGVRGEAETGFSNVFNYALDLYESSSTLDENSRLVHTLLGIMGKCQDTTILHRHNYDTLINLQKKSEKISQSGGIINSKLKKDIDELHQYNEKYNISPGGCADLLALTVFLSKCKKYFFTS